MATTTRPQLASRGADGREDDVDRGDHGEEASEAREGSQTSSLVFVRGVFLASLLEPPATGTDFATLSAPPRAGSFPVHAIPERQAVAAVALSLSYSLVAAPARAQIEPVRLVYQAYAKCPNEALFVHEVEAHVEHARPAIGDEPARTFLVAVNPDGNRSRGVLQITGVDGAVSRREVSGESCAEVVSALALMTALGIDPRAVATSPTAGIEGGAPDSSVGSNAPTESPKRSPSAPDPAGGLPSSAEALSRPAQQWRWGFGVDGQMLAGFVPEWAAGGGVFVDLAGTGAGPLVPSFRVSLLAAATQAFFESGVGAHLTWLTARIEGCPARLRLASLVATVCLKLDTGLLLSDGTGLADADGNGRPWLVPGALGRLTWPSHGGPWIEGAAGLGVPLERYSFYYQQAGVTGATEVFRVPAVGAELGLGAGYRFP